MFRLKEHGSETYETTTVMNTLRIFRMERRGVISNEEEESESGILVESGAEVVNAGKLITTDERDLIERMMAI